MQQHLVNAPQDRRRGFRPCTVGVIQLIGGQVAQVLQQYGAAPGQGHAVQVQRALYRGELLFGPHGAVLRHAGGALGVPDLHRRQIGARQRCAQAERLRIGAFAAGRAADDQRQHCGVYGVMPPSANE